MDKLSIKKRWMEKGWEKYSSNYSQCVIIVKNMKVYPAQISKQPKLWKPTYSLNISNSFNIPKIFKV